MSQMIQLDIPIDRICEYCTTQPITRLSLFGLALHDERTLESDVDLLVEY